jgi:hypothetical protein
MMLMMTMTATTIFVGRMMADNKVMDRYTAVLMVFLQNSS